MILCSECVHSDLKAIHSVVLYIPNVINEVLLYVRKYVLNVRCMLPVNKMYSMIRMVL